MSNLKPEDVGKLTDHQAWAWYIRPAMERMKKIQAMSDQGGADADSVGPAAPGDRILGLPDQHNELEVLAYLRQIGVVGVPPDPPAKE